MRRLLLLACLSFGTAAAQHTDLLLNHDLYPYIDRLDIQGRTGGIVYTSLRPYGLETLQAVFARTDTSRMGPAERALHQRMRLLADDSLAFSQQGRGVFRTFYRNRRNLYTLQKPGLRLIIDPVLHFAGGLDANTFPFAARPSLPLYANTRGAVIRGSLLDRIGFYTEVTENISRLPQFIYEQYRTGKQLFGEAFVKPFGTENALDYLGSRAYLTYTPNRAIRIKFGKDRVFWGNGRQSLLLSDHAPDHLMLNLTTRIWKLEYVNHFTQMIDFIPGKGDTEGTHPRKYGVFHQLNYYPVPAVAIGLFESVIYQPLLPNGRRGFELQYLNPVIFYRAIEQYVGSPDNAMLGLSLKWNLFRTAQLYGQLLIDDYNFGFRDLGDGYWGNKTGFQAGLRYIDAFRIPTLDLQAEYNRVRPFTYQHFNTASNYAHYGQYLGHAAGANLSDWYFGLRWRPLPVLHAELAYSGLDKGLDENGINYGGDISIPHTSRPGEFNNRTGQGVPFRVRQAYGRLSWQLWRLDAWLELEGRYRTENELRSLSFLGGLRATLAPRPVRF